MSQTCEKFANQVNAETLASLRALAEKEGRPIQSLGKEAVQGVCFLMNGLRRIAVEVEVQAYVEYPR